eukprot:364905-Chlamydomonas_euryale.AAC.19
MLKWPACMKGPGHQCYTDGACVLAVGARQRVRVSEPTKGARAPLVFARIGSLGLWVHTLCCSGGAQASNGKRMEVVSAFAAAIAGLQVTRPG